jgi:glycosyltransferase involved in cell wall biosynthesis
LKLACTDSALVPSEGKDLSGAMHPNRGTPTSPPLVTLAIRHYNNAPFVAAALEAAFAQTLTPIEILFVDDCSSDGGFEIARAMLESYSGPHMLTIARNERNLGPGGQMMRVRDLAKSGIIVFADADDISLPRRCERVFAMFRDGGPDLLGVMSYFDLIDAGGEMVDPTPGTPGNRRERAETWTSEMLAGGIAATMAAIFAVRRRVLEVGLPLDMLRRGEDHVCGLRCALLGRMSSIPEVLVQRRIHYDNVSSPVRSAWSAAECRARFAREMREAVLVPPLMRRDLAGFVQAGLVSSDRAAPVHRALLLHARRLKVLRLATHRSTFRAWMSVCDLQRLGLSLRDSVRSILPAVAPRLEVMRLRRNTISRIAPSQASD